MSTERNSKNGKVRRLITIDTDLNDALITKSRETSTSVNRLCAIILAWGIPRVGGGLSFDVGDNCGPEIITPSKR